jgi:hypothetical protein
MATYLTPGVYVEELGNGARPIQYAGTSTAAFLGRAPDAAHRGSPRSVTSWPRFLELFDAQGVGGSTLGLAVHGFFLNGGSRCYIVNLVTDDADLAPGLAALEAVDDANLLVAPGRTARADRQALIAHCEARENRFAILDGHNEALDDVGRHVDPADLAPPFADRGHAAVYLPWLVVRDPLDPATLVVAPPSGAVAGIYARVDTTRGVHKAPANEVVRGAVDLTHGYTTQEQDVLNPNGVNAIRVFVDRGIRVWGARTRAPAGSEWRYVNVRRLMSVLETSIQRSLQWVVFEPNDQTLWKAVRRNVEAFLRLFWREGALMGDTTEQAFFVKCDDETNPPEAVDAGRLTLLIGVALVKPAEFTVFRLALLAGT